jgi:hypothetical protein
MEYEYFTSIMTPGIALLILSTTMRLGNVRLALTELAKLKNVNLQELSSYALFAKRAACLCKGLRLLNASMMALIPSALAKLLFNEPSLTINVAITFFDLTFFLVLFSAMCFLFKESQITGKSIIAHTNEIQACSNSQV